MEELIEQVTDLAVVTIDAHTYLSYEAVTETVGDFLFPGMDSDEMDETKYRHILEAAEKVCRKLGYTDVARLTPPQVPFSAIGLYWRKPTVAPEVEESEIIVGPGRVEALRSGRLVGARLGRHGLDEVVRQHFKIPVTVSDGVYDLMRRAVEGPWRNDWKGLLHDILGMCITGGKDISPTRREFTVIIWGVGNRRYYQMEARLETDERGEPYLAIALAREEPADSLFELGHVVATAGASVLNVDFSPYLARHAAGDGGELDAFDVQQNNRAVKEGLRILSAYDVPVGDGETQRIWIITEANRSTTTVLRPDEY